MSRRASPSEPAATAARCARRLAVLVFWLGLTGIVGGPAARAQAVVDTVRYVEIVDGNVLGGWRTWQEAPDTLGYAVDRQYHFARTGQLTLDGKGLPLRMETSGQVTEDMPWFERFERGGEIARWVTPRARGDSTVTGAAFYNAVFPAHDLGVLARALLRRPSHTLPLLPQGEAQLEPLTERNISADGETQTVRLYAVQGIDLVPRYVWLDEDGATFADEWSVLAGWEPSFAELRADMDGGIAAYRFDLARALLPPKRTRPLVIRGAGLFDPTSREVRPGTSIVIDGSHILAVGPDAEIEALAGAEVIDASGRMVLPGLWDMHAHLSMPASEDAVFDRGLAAPLHLAAGVTTVRDVGSHVESLLALRSAVEADSAIGPRIIGAGFIDSDETYLADIGVLVGTEAEARAAVDRYAELGFRQVKLHAYLPPELVEVVIERARQRGLRVSGHIVMSMAAQDAVEAGYDEIQHLWWLVWAATWTNEESIAAGETWQTWHQLLAELTPDSAPVRELVALLAERGVAVDATLGYFASDGTPPDFIADQVHRFPAPVRRRLEHKAWEANYFPRSPLAQPARQQALGNMFDLLRTLHKAGVPLIIGSDTWAGFGLHYELEMFVRAGIPALEVLALATLGAARAMGMDDELGSIEPGKRADLILVDGDPTADISDIRRVVTVVKDGRVYDPAAIYRALGIEPCCEQTPRRRD